MNIDELKTILTTFKEKAPKGLGIFTLAKETNIPPQALREYLTKYNDYFVQLPNELTYQINHFGKFNGSTEQIIENHANTLQRQKVQKLSLIIVLAVVVIFYIVT